MPKKKQEREHNCRTSVSKWRCNDTRIHNRALFDNCSDNIFRTKSYSRKNLSKFNTLMYANGKKNKLMKRNNSKKSNCIHKTKLGIQDDNNGNCNEETVTSA